MIADAFSFMNFEGTESARYTSLFKLIQSATVNVIAMQNGVVSDVAAENFTKTSSIEIKAVFSEVTFGGAETYDVKAVAKV